MHGWEEMSTLNLAQLARARDMAAKLVLAGGMDDAGAQHARSLVVPQGPVSDPKLHMPASVSPALGGMGAGRQSGMHYCGRDEPGWPCPPICA